MEELMGRYLAGDLSKEERTSFESQLISDESVSQEFEAYLNVWHLTHTSDADYAFDTDKAKEEIERKALEETKVVPIVPNRSFSILKIAATVVILAVSAYFISTSLITEQLQPESMSYSSDNGVREIVLPDGTVIRMNANSTITYGADFNTSNRNVTLAGEADFDVKSNKDLPFVIDAEVSRIEVLGTKFNLAAYNNEDVLLNVTEGRVSFAAKSQVDKGAVVIKGQKAVLTIENNVIDITEVNDSNYNGWWTQKLVFENASMKDILTDLEKSFRVEFEYDAAVIKGCSLNTTFENQTIDAIVEIIIETITDGNSTKTEENKIKLFGKGCSE